MTATLEQLRALADELKGATGPSRELDGKIHDAFYGVRTWTDACAGLPKVFSYSLDAADALRREVVPGWDGWALEINGIESDHAVAELWKKGSRLPEQHYANAEHKLPAIALCLAIVEAKIKELEHA